MGGVRGVCVMLLVGCLGRDELICDSFMLDAFDSFILELIFNGLDAFFDDFSVFLTCFSMAVAMVLGGVGCSLAMVVRVWLAEFSRCCFMITRLRLKEMTLWAYWVT